MVLAASDCIKPVRVRIPASSSASAPRPLTVGFGSGCAMTTSETPAHISASEHGGVRPK